MLKIWEVDYKSHKVRVENTWFNGERLYVDNVLQDETVGSLSFSGRLFGNIKFEDGSIETIKVSLGALLISVNCRIFIDDKLVSVK